MALIWKQATEADLEELVETRVRVLRAANGLDDSAEMPQVRENSRTYYQNALAGGAHVAYLVLDGERVVGAGGVSFFQVLPTYHSPTGWKAYIMNMYTAPAYRRRGIAARTLELLVEAARRRGVTAISLEATAQGLPLYQRYGFVPMENEMELPEE